MPVLETCKFDKKLRSKRKALCPGQGQVWAFFSTQGQVHVNLRQIVEYGQNLNLFEILCLSWKPASLKKL